MEEDGPSIIIKKKKKSGSHSRNSGAAAESTVASVLDEDAAEPGDAAVVRKKKSLAEKVRDREAAKRTARLSFGDKEDSHASTRNTPLRPSITPSIVSASTNAAPPIPSHEKPRSVYSSDYLSQLRSQTQSRPSTRAGDEDMDVDGTSAEIPTANAIAAARLKRETLRKIGADTTNGKENGDGFISLDLIAAPRKKGESRLVREEDEIGEGDDELAEFTGAQERVALGRKATVAAKSKARTDAQDLINDAEGEAIDEDDEEAMQWEAAQVRRAGDQMRQRAPEESLDVYRPATIPQVVQVPSLEGVQSRLEASLKTLEASHTADDEVLQSLEAEVGALDQQETELREEVVRLNKKHEWFASFYEWVEDVTAFLDTKFPRLEHIERDNLAHQRERLQMLANRRYADDSDDVSLFTGEAVQSRLIPPASRADPDAAPPTLPAPDSPFSDERMERRLARQDRHAELSDEVLDDDSTLDLVRAVATLTTSLAELLNDVESDDFKDPVVGVRKRFAEWRSEYPQEYGQAFGTLAMVGMWGFWARYEMAIWNPFKVPLIGDSPASLDGYAWHRELAHYSHDAPPVAPGLPHDDTEPVTALVESVVVPRLQLLASQAYDLYSATATSSALHFVEEVTFCIDRRGQRYEALMQTFLMRIYDEVSKMQSLVLPHVNAVSMPLHALDADALAARNRFTHRVLLLATQILRWKRHAKGLLVRGWGVGLEDGIARELIGKVALPIVEAGWLTGGEEIAGQLAALYPGDTLPSEVRSRLVAP